MTVFVGKDVVVKINTVQVAEAKEISVEVDNGKQDCYVLGESTIQEFVYTLMNVSGTMSFYYVDYGFITDVTTHGTTKTLTLEFGTVPDYTVTLSTVVYSDVSINFSPDEPITGELSFKAGSFSIA